MTESSLLDVNLNDAKEFRTLPDNDEARVTITLAQITESKSDSPADSNLMLELDPGESDVESFRTWTPIPNEAWKSVDEKGYVRAVNRFKELMDCFGIQMPIDTSAIVGLSGWIVVSEEEDDRTGKMRNSVRRYVVSQG